MSVDDKNGGQRGGEVCIIRFMVNIAHITETGKAQTLADHLAAVSQLAREFSEDFAASELTELVGRLHDMGKNTVEFQEYIRGQRSGSTKTHHAAAGAWQLLELAKEYTAVKVLLEAAALAIQGHHTGLHAATLFHEKDFKIRAENAFQRAVKGGWECPAIDKIAIPPWLMENVTDCNEAMRRIECLVRLIFSALIDADRLDTEEFCSPSKAAVRGNYDSLETLLARLNDYTGQFKADTPVNKLRADMLSQCIAKADSPAGVFSLSMPTGGGKTLASIAFALRHAIANNLRRIIVAIPYTSIIDQNAEIYSSIFGENNVLQHHCNLDPDRYDGQENESQKLLAEELACENWDKPIIVTTNVQLLESMFSSHPSRCRKLHNIAGSVMVFDEAQTLPPAMLEQTLEMLKTFVMGCNCSVVCCTATKPAWGTIKDSLGHVDLKGIDNVTEILDEPEHFHHTLERVSYHWPENMNETIGWSELAEKITEHPKCLVIVPLRRHVRELIELLPGDTIGLSALMTPANRKEVLEKIKARLAKDDSTSTCRVISTSLVEAGVDMDFPVVFRAIGPLDSIAQAGGRCNREGKLKGKGNVYVFIPPANHMESSVIGKGCGVTKSLVNKYRHNDCQLSFNDPEIFTEYFRELYGGCNVDKNNIQSYRTALNFPETDKNYRLIDNEWAKPMIISHDEKAKDALMIISQHNKGENFSSADILRRARTILQQYTVSVSQKVIQEWSAARCIEQLYENADPNSTPHVLHEAYIKSAYDSLGLNVSVLPEIDSSQLIV